MFAKETYMQRRALLKKNLGSGVLLFLGNDECGLNYEDNTFRYRQDSTFLYYFGLSCAGLSAIIDIDEDKEIIFGDELSIDAIVWMGSQPTLREKCERVGIREMMASADIVGYLHKCVQSGKAIHYLPPYRPEHKLKLMDWLGIPPARQEGSVPFIRAVIAQRNYKSAEEIVEIEKACDVTADMHITAMKVLRPGMYEYEVVAEMNRVAESNNCELSFATIATINGQTLHNHYHGNKVKPGDLFLIDAGAEVESGYAGDMSSTIPADKKFTTRQREVYEIQNAMHLESVKALRPGIPYMDVYELSARVMVDGMKTLGLMKGNTEDAVREGAHALFYPHGLGHMMGLDVHDMENMGRIQRSAEEHAVRTQVATPRHSTGTGIRTYRRTGHLLHPRTDRYVESRKEVHRFYQLRQSGNLQRLRRYPQRRRLSHHGDRCPPTRQENSADTRRSGSFKITPALKDKAPEFT